MEWSTYQKEFETKANHVINWVNSEYNLIRSGRIGVSIFDKVRVMAYGEEIQLNQIANIQIVSATQALIKPYDRSQIPDILKGIAKANFNVNPIANPDSVRINFPAQTEENRRENVKKAKQILEQGKIKIRDVRKDIQSSYKKLDNVSEDLLHYFEDELNNITKKYNSQLENLFAQKEKELMTI